MTIFDRIARLSGVDLKSAENTNPKEQAQQSKATRTVGIGSQILVDLNVHKMRLLSPLTKYNSLSGFNLEVTEYIEDK